MRELFSYRSFRNLWVSSLLATLGGSAFPIALAVVVLDAGGDASTLGLILGARVLSSVLFTLIGGVWADRLPRKYVLIGSDVTRAFLVLILVFISANNVPEIILGLLVFLMGIGDAFAGPASGAILPGILPDHMLPQGNVARGIVLRIGNIVGPGLGGVGVAFFGGQKTFLITFVTYVIAASILLRVVEKPLLNPSLRPSFISELREGLVTVWRIPWVAACIAMATFQLMVVLGTSEVLLPVIARREFGRDYAFATGFAAFSLAGMISSLIAIRFKAKHPGLISVTVWGFFAVAPLTLAFPISENFVIAGYFIAGLSLGPWEAYWSTAIQREIPQELQGRVFSIDYMGSVGLMPIGMAMAGPVTELFGEQRFLIGAAIFHIVVCAIVLMVPGVKDLRMPTKNYSEGEQSKS